MSEVIIPIGFLFHCLEGKEAQEVDTEHGVAVCGAMGALDLGEQLSYLFFSKVMLPNRDMIQLAECAVNITRKYWF